jgi:ATP-dependent protease ClpP protease subunit
MEMFGISSPDTVTPALDRLNYWLRTAEAPLTIEFIINSPGGEVMAGMELFDKILEVRAGGHTVITKAVGLAASAASTLMQAGSVREGGPNSFQIIHEPSTGVHGKIGVIRDEIKFLERISDRVASIYVDRSQQCGAPKPLTLKYFTTQWKDHDWSLDAYEAYNLGIIDRISGQAPAGTETSARRKK